jgi:ferrous iron transport protein B
LFDYYYLNLTSININFTKIIVLNSIPKIALVGNPNCGKTSLFNALTGLNQKVGNFAGVTVEGKIGSCNLPNNAKVNIIDLPGTYSLYPKSGDEYVAYDAIFGEEYKPEIIIVVVDATNLKRNLLFATQVIDLGLPVVIALSMLDIAARKEIKIDIDELSIQLGIPIVGINPRKNKGIKSLGRQLNSILDLKQKPVKNTFINNSALAPELIQQLKQKFPSLSDYACLHIAAETDQFHYLSEAQKSEINQIKTQVAFNKNKTQAKEILQRYSKINTVIQRAVVEMDPLKKELRSEKMDKLLLHPLYGNLILLFVLFTIFQALFWLASFPMDWIDGGLAYVTAQIAAALPDVWWARLLTSGVLAGVAGILVFVPQIMILFGLITLLEDSGYMARISFLTDRLMRGVGLSGRSVMPLISGMACAVPAILSARTIDNYRERLITIMITPLMSCSARLPVYTVLITLAIPRKFIGGFISIQGLVMLGLYLLGFFVALLIAKMSSVFFKKKGNSLFLMELPIYKAPRWPNVLRTMIEKAKIFVFDAGKVILFISIALWFLSNYSPKNSFTTAYTKPIVLEESYAGIAGKAIEPIFKPLGFDWKIDIALITSFAAREVFVGTMATLYSANEEDTSAGSTLVQKMSAAKRSDGSKVYTLATGVSLLLFYVFAMQCMSTLAIVYRETKSWKYPVYQFIYMFALAYLFSWVAFRLLN